MADAEAEALIGELIDGRYRVLRCLGRGGMGVVFEVEHERIGRRFALKMLHAQFAKDEELVTRFQREARAAGTIGNEHIIEVSDMGYLPGGEPYIVMELLDGKELAAEIEACGRLSVGRAVHIATQVCDALSATHEKGIVHRDLKPENIYLISRSPKTDFVKLIDFGISKFKGVSEGPGGRAMTATGTAMGTPYYMPPEQATGAESVDGRADVYSLGVVLFELLTGRRPFEANSMAAILVKIMQEPPPSVTAVSPEVPAELEAIVHRAMAKNPDHRFASTAEMSSALAAFLPSRGEPRAVDAFGPTREVPAHRLPPTRETPAVATPSIVTPAVAGPSFATPVVAKPAVATPRHTLAQPPGPHQFAVMDESVRLPNRRRGMAIVGALLFGLGILTAAAAVSLGAEGPAPEALLPVDELGAPRRTEPSAATPAAIPVEPVAAGEPSAVQEPRDIGTTAEPIPNVEEPDTPGASGRRRPGSRRPRQARGTTMMAPEPAAPSQEEPPAAQATASRPIVVENRRQATVRVTFHCGDVTRSVDAPSLSETPLGVPAGACRVTCTGRGRPSCLPSIQPGTRRLVIGGRGAQ